MVQSVGNENKRPGALPYALGGAAVGGLAGWGASKLDFTKAAKYNSWDDVLKDSKDIFKAAGEDGASDTVKNAKTAIEDAMKTYKETVRNAFKEGDAFKKLSEEVANNKKALDGQRDNFKTLYKDLLDDLIKNDGAFEFNHNGKTGKELEAEASKYIKELLGKKDVNAEWKKVTDLQAAKTSYTEAASKLKGVKLNELTEATANKVKQANTDAWEAVKDKVKDFKKPRTLLLAAGLAAAGLLAGLMLRPKAKPVEEA